MSIFVRKSIFKTALGFAATALLLTATATAQDTKTQTFSIGSPLQCLSSTGNFTLPDFDSSLGTLESINLTLTITNCSKIQVFNNSNQSVDFTNASLNLLGSVSGPGGTTLNTSVTASIPSGTAHLGLNCFPTTKNSTTVSSLLDPSLFSLWQDQDGNVVDLSYVKGDPTFAGTALGNGLFFGGEIKGYGKVTVEYTYLSGGNGSPIATPEPAGGYLSAIAAAGMMFMLFGRRKLLKI